MTHADPTPRKLEFVEEDRVDIITALAMQVGALSRMSERADLAPEEADHYAHRAARMAVLAGRLQNEQLYGRTTGATVLQSSFGTVPARVNQTEQDEA